ncbi:MULTISPECIES: hypothetical protein [Dehalobacter]|jgi:hypothetical protein|uniref:Uncharacterized protein n=2 Tax=Dehalobacter restrictus TaxID=55583 RepID=A0A857DFI8_9FIRM|nr:MULTISPECIES: hypothetical protein [Dehalobacter]AHF08811.1 hypothetical protein DEHRE_00585 [Dehalobacter restrictus DSM 9455]MCG1024170.1 hypothetical protein [Dehalobacter sp.]MDJ0305348.1 hypothetical protein [Dehalobacter sp.]OCZ49987.1 hypothetical protein A7D23_01205 [Dehalobacter sp. TeCB1]QGZ99308.1 hypothetical protein GQ588_00780 [Dehalobacter restrictus]
MKIVPEPITHVLKKKHALWSIIVLALLFFNGCSLAKPEPKPAPSPSSEQTENIAAYIPLSVGNYWFYEGIGNEYASYTEKVTYQQRNQYQVIIDNGGTVTANRYEVAADRIVNTFRQSEFYEDKNILDQPSNIEAILLQSPLTSGNSWTSEGNSYEIIDTAATVEVPAGIFENCLTVKITYPESGNYSLYYYKKDVGLIKSEYVMPENEKVVSQLKEYDVQH